MPPRQEHLHVRTRLYGSQCVYCGQTPNVLDHWPPLARCAPGFLLPCCTECNSIAGDRWADNFLMRLKFVKERLRSRYKKLLKTPEWSEEEISELGYSLIKAVRHVATKTTEVKERLVWDGLAYIASIDQCEDFDPLFTPGPIHDRE